MSSRIKELIAVSILTFINFIYIYKYVLRYTEWALLISIFISGIQLTTFLKRDRLYLSKKIKWTVSGFAILFVLSLIVISYLYIPIETLNVDRWSIMSSYISHMLDGKYPYFATSFAGNPPGPMPFYYLIALPFYALGEYSILSALGYLGIIIWIFKTRITQNNIVFVLLYFLSSFAMIWEITTRSNIFTFSCLVLLALNLHNTKVHINKLHVFIYGLICGLALCTRSVFILAYIVFFTHDVFSKAQSRKTIIFLTYAFIGFIIPFAPLLIEHYNDFWIMNPFIVQSSFFLPTYYVIIFILIAFALSIFSKSYLDKLFYSGVSLFIVILIYSSYHLIHSGFQVSYIDSKVDISYFIFSIPFLLMYLLANKNNDKSKLSTVQDLNI